MASRHGVLVAWRIVDGRRGHENQSLGLVNALKGLADTGRMDHVLRVEEVVLKAMGRWQALSHLFTGRKWRSDLPWPDLIIGAGHGTHLTLLAAQRLHGGRTVVIMKPSFPRKWFDLCLIPQHDGIPRDEGVETTRGALNAIPFVPIEAHDAGRGLILVGGPSDHYGWSQDRLLEQISALLAHDAEMTWTLTTSPRTPDGFIPALEALPSLKSLGGVQESGQLTIVPWQQTGADWLPQRYREAAVIWVTEDSVSMLYESLSSGAAVGLLTMEKKGQGGRVARGLEPLIDEGLLTPFAAWQSNPSPLNPPKTPFNEAQRAARLIQERWLTNAR